MYRSDNKSTYYLPRFIRGIVILYGFALLPCSLQAATIEVTSNLDDGTDCTLREALATVNAGSDQVNGCVVSGVLGTDDTINLASIAGMTITLGGTELTITRNVVINGSSVTISGNIRSRVFSIIGSSLDVQINALTITNGFVNTNGGGIYVDRLDGILTVTITNSTVSGNRASNDGGGIYVDVDTIATITNSTVLGNIADNGGGIYTKGRQLILTNSTVSGNIAGDDGGGVHVDSGTTLINSTMSGNHAIRNGGGIYVNRFRLLRLFSSAIANSSIEDCSGLGIIIADSNSIIEDGSCGTSAMAVDPMLGPLTDNGGPTQTHALMAGSPAINAGNNSSCPATDQRGFTRTDGACDIGAFELDAVDPNAIEPVTLVNNRWTMVSLSADAPSKTVQDVFSTTTPTGLAAAEYMTKWVVYERDEANDSYVMLNLSSLLQQGIGYWVLQITGSDVDFAPAGAPTPVTMNNPLCPSPQAGCFEIDLTPPEAGGTSLFNLIGHPFDVPVNWSAIRLVVNGSQVCTPQQAAANNLLTDAFWHYNGNGYDNFSTSIPPGGGSFEAFKGYWVELLQGTVGETVTLLIPKGPATDQPSCQAISPLPVTEARPKSGQSDSLPWWLSWISTAKADNILKSGEWWVRLQADSDEAGGMSDKYNYLGWYRDSEDGKDRRDVKELPPFGSPYLTIVFPHHDWGDDNGEYASDMRKRKYWREGEEWEFVVKSDQPGREVTLSWEGYDRYRRFWRMRLVDVETGKEVRTVRRRQLQTYTFNMYDTEHRFKWVYKTRPKQ